MDVTAEPQKLSALPHRETEPVHVPNTERRQKEKPHTEKQASICVLPRAWLQERHFPGPELLTLLFKTALPLRQDLLCVEH